MLGVKLYCKQTFSGECGEFCLQVSGSNLKKLIQEKVCVDECSSHLQYDLFEFIYLHSTYDISCFQLISIKSPGYLMKIAYS